MDHRRLLQGALDDVRRTREKHEHELEMRTLDLEIKKMELEIKKLELVQCAACTKSMRAAVFKDGSLITG